MTCCNRELDFSPSTTFLTGLGFESRMEVGLFSIMYFCMYVYSADLMYPDKTNKT